MDNPWKLTTIGMALVLVTAITTGLATAYFIGPTDTRPVTSGTDVRGPGRVGYARTQPTRQAQAAPRYVATAAPATGCDRNAKIVNVAKDGLVGGLLGAALGAGTGAIVDGGRAAGKGAAIGGLAGAAAGGLYGAHQNRTNCG